MQILSVQVPAEAHGITALDDVTLAYSLFEPAGNRKGDVVCVHGLTRQKRDFDYIATFLAAGGYRVFSFDAPGRGESSPLPPAFYDLAFYADIFNAALQTLRIEHPHWIGTSMGGLIALTMAAKGLAKNFASLTLVDITHQPNAAACARIADYVVEDLPVLQSIEQYLDIQKVNLPLGTVSEDVWQHYAEHQLRKTDGGYRFHFDPKIARLAQPALRRPIDITNGITALACPLALVAGGKSDLCTKTEIGDLMRLRTDLQLHICPDAGHIPALADAPTQKFILDFLDQA